MDLFLIQGGKGGVSRKRAPRKPKPPIGQLEQVYIDQKKLATAKGEFRSLLNAFVGHIGDLIAKLDSAD